MRKIAKNATVEVKMEQPKKSAMKSSMKNKATFVERPKKRVQVTEMSS